MKKISPILFIIFLANNFWAQNLEQMNQAELDSMTALYRESGQYDLAVKGYQIAIKRAKAIGNDTIVGDLLNNIAAFYNEIDKYELSEQNYFESMKIRERLFGRKHLIYAQSLNNLATLYERIGEYEKAEDNHKEAMEIRKVVAGEQSFEYALSLRNLGLVYLRLERFEEAENFIKKSLPIYEKEFGKESLDYAGTLSLLAGVYDDTKRFEEAEPLYLSSLAVLKKELGGEHPNYALVLGNLANLYDNWGRLEEAISLMEECMQIEAKVLGKDHFYYAISLNNLAGVYEELRQYPKAISLVQQSLEIKTLTVGKEHPSYANSLTTLARLSAQTKNYIDAERLYLEGLEIYKKKFGIQHGSYIGGLVNLGGIYKKMGKYTEAEKLFLQALELDLKTVGEEKGEDIANTLLSLCYLYNQIKNAEKAKLFLDRAFLANCQNCGTAAFDENMDFLDKKVYSNIMLFEILDLYYSHFQVLYEQGNDKIFLEKAYRVLSTNINLMEKNRSVLVNENDQLRFLEQQSKNIGNIIKTGLLTPKDNIHKDLFYFAELNKSALLTDATKSFRAHSLSDLPDSLALLELRLLEKLDELKKQELSSANESDKQNATKALNALNIEMDAFKKKLKEQFPKYHQLKYANITATAENVQKLLDNQTLFLEFFVSDSIVYLFSISKKEVKLIPLKTNKQQLSAKITNLRKALTDYNFIEKKTGEAYQLYTETAYWFYENLLADVLLKPSAKTIKSLLIVADGELGHLPFEVFLSKQAPQSQTPYNQLHYLVKDFNISYNYSATLWKENMENPAKKNNSKILAVAAEYNKNSLDSTKLRSNRAPHLLNLRDGLIELPAAQQEVLTLSKKFNGSFWVGNDANEQSFKKNATEFGIIHLAMHGILNQNTPILSSLAFTENHDSIDDNFLEAWEIAHLKLNADLVVLSACETGFGKFQQGEGIMSLARSFMYAGVPSLVVSLWQVNDYSTAILMQSFYQYLASGKLKDEALRQAKLDYLEVANGVAAHPAFWSAFIQLGDNRAVQVKTQFFTSKSLWVIVAGLIIFVFGFILYRKKAALR